MSYLNSLPNSPLFCLSWVELSHSGPKLIHSCSAQTPEFCLIDYRKKEFALELLTDRYLQTDAPAITTPVDHLALGSSVPGIREGVAAILPNSRDSPSPTYL